MKYVTAREMKEIDRYTIAECGIPAAFLMENAGRAVAEEVKKLIPEGTISVFCGYGNNGGDGLVAARHLLNEKYDVRIFLAGNPKPFTPETEANYQALVNLKCQPATIRTTEETKRILGLLSTPDLVIDAIFGIGIRSMLDDFYLTLIRKLNSFDCPVIAVDIPSGLDADTGSPLGLAVKAVMTVTMGFPKSGFKNKGAGEFLGKVVVADIGLKTPGPDCPGGSA